MDPPTSLLRRAWAHARRNPIDSLLPTLVGTALIVLTALQISGSSISIYSQDGTPNDRYIVAGGARPIRSDEWLAWSPIKTGRVRADFPERQTFGMGSVELSDSWRPQVPSRSIGAALYSPFNLPLVLLPIDQGFALMWWLPFAACCLGVFAWLRAMRVRAFVALCAALVATTAPAMVWWSGWLCQIVASATIPAAIVIAAARCRRTRPRSALLIAVVGGLAAASLPWFYQPWVVPTALFVGGVTVLWALSEPELRRSFAIVAAIAGAVFGVEQIVYYVHESSYYETLADTVYPGDRRSTGGGVNVGHLFSSLFPFTLSSSRGGALVDTNLSEISMGWTVTAPLAVMVAALGRAALRGAERILVLGSVLLTVVISSWSLIAWPRLLSGVTLFDRVPPTRVAPLVGFFGVVCLALLFGVDERRERLIRQMGTSGAWVATGAVALLLAWGATLFRSEFLPGLSDARVWASVVLVSALVGLLLTRWWVIPLGVSTILAVASGIAVNPLTEGTAALGQSRSAALVRRIDDRVLGSTNGRWAADDMFVGGLLNGEGVDSLSSFNDPVSVAGWRILDPRGSYEAEWNRFAYIVFAWQAGVPHPTMENPSTDVVRVTVDPCDTRLSKLRLRLIVASEPLASSCLTRLEGFQWMGTTYSVYERRDGATT